MRPSAWASLFLAGVLVAACSGDDAANGNQPGEMPDGSGGGQAGATGSATGGGGAGGAAGAPGSVDGASGSVSIDGPPGDRDSSVGDASSGSITIATGLKKPTGIALTARDVYWADETDGTIVTCPKTGCGQGAPIVVVTGQIRPHGIAIHNSVLYWVTHELNVNPPSSTYRCALPADGGSGACRPADIVDLGLQVDGPDGMVGIAVSDDRVYVAGGTPNIPSCPITGCGDAGQALFGGLGGPKWGIALGSAGLYYTLAFGQVGLCSINGCMPGPMTLVSTNSPFAVAVDNERLYWSSSLMGAAGTDGAIRSCPLAGCNVASSQVLAAGQIGPYALAVDDSSIYFTDARNGRVERRPKNDFAHTCDINLLGSCEACAGYVQCNGSCNVSCSDSGPDGI